MPAKSKRKEPPASNSKLATKIGAATVSWPPFKPLVPTCDLSLNEVVPTQIVTISNFFTQKLCKDYVAFLKTLPLQTTPGKPKRGDALRVNDRFQIDDPAFAERLWSETALKSLILASGTGDNQTNVQEGSTIWGGEALGLNSNIRVYRYTKGQFFDQHYDDFNDVVMPGTSPIKGRTTWTLLLYLTSPATGCLGGETVFYPEVSKKTKAGSTDQNKPIVVELEEGMALLHRHGADCMLHEGREVTAGEKWVIRSDLVVRR